MRKGDSAIATLVLDLNPGASALPSLAGGKGEQTRGSASPQDIYATHNVIAEAQLDMAGMDVLPSETVSEPLLPGDSAIFRWRLHAAAAGDYEGTSWFFLDFVDKSTQEQSRVALSAQTVRISVTSLFGLGSDSARLAGGLGLILGVLVGLPDADELLKWLRGKGEAAH